MLQYNIINDEPKNVDMTLW